MIENLKIVLVWIELDYCFGSGSYKENAWNFQSSEGALCVWNGRRNYTLWSVCKRVLFCKDKGQNSFNNCLIFSFFNLHFLLVFSSVLNHDFHFFPTKHFSNSYPNSRLWFLKYFKNIYNKSNKLMKGINIYKVNSS